MSSRSQIVQVDRVRQLAAISRVLWGDAAICAKGRQGDFSRKCGYVLVADGPRGIRDADVISRAETWWLCEVSGNSHAASGNEVRLKRWLRAMGVRLGVGMDMGMDMKLREGLSQLLADCVAHHEKRFWNAQSAEDIAQLPNLDWLIHNTPIVVQLSLALAADVVRSPTRPGHITLAQSLLQLWLERRTWTWAWACVGVGVGVRGRGRGRGRGRAWAWACVGVDV